MVTIDKMTMTVTVEGGGDGGQAAFERMFARAMERWWREQRARAEREARTAADRAVGGRGGGG
jgi:ribosomal protein S9